MADIVFIEVKDQNFLTIDSSVLTSNSPVFAKLILEHSQTEIELKNYETDMVKCFLNCLESGEKKVEVIESQHFRELHKLAVNFEVDWLMQECHRHLIDKLDFQKLIKGFGSKSTILVWNECKFMVEEWGSRFSKFVDLYVESVRSVDGIWMEWKEDENLEYFECCELNRKIVHEFINKIDAFTPLEMDVLLRISSVSQLDLILIFLVKSLHQHLHLTDSTIHLLENLNLPLCRIKFPDLYENVLVSITDKFCSSSEVDKKFLFDVLKDASRVPRVKEIEPECEIKNFEWMRDNLFLSTTDDFLTVAKSEIVKSLNTVVDYILNVIFTFQDDDLPHVDAEYIVTKLEELYFEGKLRKAHRQYLEGALNSVEWLRLQKDSKMDCHTCESTGWIWEYSSSSLERRPCPNISTAIHFHFDTARLQYVKILKLIKENSDLSSSWDYLMVFPREETLQGEILKFNFRHPAVPECSRIGNCGFFLKTEKRISSLTGKDGTFVHFHRDDTWSNKKVKDEDRIHCHDVISPDEMNLFYTEFSVEDRVNKCWLPTALFEKYIKKFDEGVRNFALYNVASYLVKKSDVSNC